MIWTDRAALGLWTLFCLMLFFFWARGDMEGFGGFLFAVGWSGLYLALPLAIALRVLRFIFTGSFGRRHGDGLCSR